MAKHEESRGIPTMMVTGIHPVLAPIILMISASAGRTIRLG